jgi:hypothetical protein
MRIYGDDLVPREATKEEMDEIMSDLETANLILRMRRVIVTRAQAKASEPEAS